MWPDSVPRSAPRWVPVALGVGLPLTSISHPYFLRGKPGARSSHKDWLTHLPVARSRCPGLRRRSRAWARAISARTVGASVMANSGPLPCDLIRCPPLSAHAWMPVKQRCVVAATPRASSADVERPGEWSIESPGSPFRGTASTHQARTAFGSRGPGRRRAWSVPVPV